MGSFYDLLERRRAVRSYTAGRVPRETLQRIARAARRRTHAGRRRRQDEVMKWNRWRS